MDRRCGSRRRVRFRLGGTDTSRGGNRDDDSCATPVVGSRPRDALSAVVGSRFSALQSVLRVGDRHPRASGAPRRFDIHHQSGRRILLYGMSFVLVPGNREPFPPASTTVGSRTTSGDANVVKKKLLRYSYCTVVLLLPSRRQ